LYSFKNKLSVRSFQKLFLATAVGVLVSGCGGGSGDDNSSSDDTASITGSVFAAHVNGASCEIQNSSGANISGSFITNSSGIFNTEIPASDLANDLMLVCEGGTYTDEANGTPHTAGTLSAYIEGGALTDGGSIHATPGSTILQQVITSHSTNMVIAQGIYNDAFGYIPDTTVEPTDATAPATGASESELVAGLRAAAFSQLTYDLGLGASEQFSLLTALAQDLSDGSLDGEDDSGAITFGISSTTLPVNIKTQFSEALMNFHGGASNATGLEIGQIFGTSVLTESYKVEYTHDEMMDSMMGKDQFQIQLTYRDTGFVASGKTVSLMPMMSMNSMMHATPVDGCSEDNDYAGTYNCTLYYTMSSMGGYWDLNVIIGGMMMNGMMMGGEEAHFYPSVMMAADTSATLKNSGDAFEMMGMSTIRPYSLFKSNLTGENNNHTFEIFIAAEVSMMSYPAVYQGITLSADTTDELTINSMSVEMTTTPDDDNSWVTAVSIDNGYWTASSISGLTNGSEGNIYVRMFINDVQYSNTVGGDVANSDNGHVIFTVTPSNS